MADSNLCPFREIHFGDISAEAEAETTPALLQSGFLNLHGIVDTLLSGRQCIVLGRKGTGKSAIAKHLKLSVANESTFIDVNDLVHFRYNDLKTLLQGDKSV